MKETPTEREFKRRFAALPLEEQRRMLKLLKKECAHGKR